MRTRTEREMMSLILSTAEQDPRVRAVVMNGSRVNPDVPPDLLQDYDIIYVVQDVEGPIRDPGWIDVFGPRLILQTPDDMGPSPSVPPRRSYAYLIQFLDGNRMDLTLVRQDAVAQLVSDTLSRPLLDKDGILPPFGDPDDRGYRVGAPGEKEFADCCNEFFWVAPYVAKGLWRGQPVYARHCLEQILQNQVEKMLVWEAAADAGTEVNAGAYGKYLDRMLPAERLRLLHRTWKTWDIPHMWAALFTMVRLFRPAALQTARACGYAYPWDEDRNVSAFLRHLRHLPQDADRIYDS